MKRNHRTALFFEFAPAAASDACGTVPDWIHLCLSGTFRATDGRGPFVVADPAALVAASLPRLPMPVDQDHATDVTKSTGCTAPARGWIVELEARADGVWGRVEWTASGRALLEDRAYRGISPVITYDDNGRVLQILRAALTNDPALDQLTALMMSEDTNMDWRAKMIEALGLAATATDDELTAALSAQAAANAAQNGGGQNGGGQAAMSAEVVNELRAQLAAVTAQVTTLKLESATAQAATLTAEATRVVDAAITEGKPIKPQRDTWIQMMAADPERTKAALAAIPSINGAPITGEDGQKQATLSAEEQAVVKMMGLTTEAYLAAKSD